MNIITDLNILLKDFKIIDKAFQFKKEEFDKSDLFRVKQIKDKLYNIYNRSNIYPLIPAQNLISLYESILKKNERANNLNFWFVKEKTSNTSINVQKGFIEKNFNFTFYNPSIQINLNKINEIVDFEYPYFYIDDSHFWLLGKDFPQITNDELCRFYFNLNGVSVEAINIIFRFLLNELDEANISYKFKLPINSNLFNRADNAVLYLDKLYLEISAPILSKLFLDLSPFLRKEVPLFTKEIKSGIGFAEEPHDDFNRSFGQNKIDIIFEILKNTRRTLSEISNDELIKFLIEKINARFTKGFAFNEKTLYNESIINKIFELNPDFVNRIDSFIVNKTHKSLNNIALQLCSSSIIFDDRISWLRGQLNTNDIKPQARSRITLTNSPRNYHIGKLGIGWFLSKVHKISKDELILRVCKMLYDNLIETSDSFEEDYYLIEQEVWFKSYLKDELIGGFSYIHRFNEKINKIDITHFGNKTKELLWFLDIIINFKNELGLTKLGQFGNEELRLKLIKFVEQFKIGLEKEISVFISKIEDLTKQSKSANSLVSLNIILSNIESNKKELVRTESELLLLCEKMLMLDGISINNFLSFAGEKLQNYQFSKEIEYLENIVLKKAIESGLSMRTTFDFKSKKLFPRIETVISQQIFDLDFEINTIDLSINTNSYKYLLFEEITFSNNANIDYPKRELLKNVALNFYENIIDKFFLLNVFPKFCLNQDFYNPGLCDGVVGLGYLILINCDKKIKRLPTQCFSKEL